MKYLKDLFVQWTSETLEAMKACLVHSFFTGFRDFVDDDWDSQAL